MLLEGTLTHSADQDLTPKTVASDQGYIFCIKGTSEKENKYSEVIYPSK